MKLSREMVRGLQIAATSTGLVGDEQVAVGTLRALRSRGLVSKGGFATPTGLEELALAQNAAGLMPHEEAS